MIKNNLQPLIEKEKKHSTLILICFLILTLTGIFTIVFNSHNTVNQLIYISHTLAGLIFIPGILAYSYLHFKRTLGQRRPLLILSGSIAFIIILATSATGLDIVYRGQTETTNWIYLFHIYISLSSSAIIILHVISHFLSLSKQRKQADTSNFPGSSDNILKVSTYWTSGVFISILALSYLYDKTAPVYTNQSQVTPYQYSYGDHPFRPSETETSTGNFIDPRQITGSTACGDCHEKITRQWESSAHKLAASDKSYVSNITLLSENVSMAATRYCEGCHAPTALLTGQLTKGGNHGGVSGTDAFNEGVGCLACHNIEKAIHVKGNASYLYKPHQDYLFANSTNRAKKMLHNFLLSIKPEQHKKDMNRDVLSKPKMCATCHAQFMDKNMNNWGWVKMQDDYTSWLKGPYSKQNQQDFSQAEITRCHDCHMPMVNDDKDPAANKDNLVQSHNFPGANTVLPLLAGDTEQLKLTKQFLQSNKMRITIEEPRRKDATQSTKYIDEKLRAKTQTPFYFYLNESVELSIIVSNVGVGHAFPGGSIDINQAWVAVSVIDAQGEIVFESGGLNNLLEVDPNAYFYRSIAIDRNGKHVWKHDLFNMVGETYRNVVPAGKSDIVKYNLNIPASTKGPLTISATLKYRKFNQRYAKWALKDEYQKIPIIDVARHSLTVPVREQLLVK